MHQTRGQTAAGGLLAAAAALLAAAPAWGLILFPTDESPAPSPRPPDAVLGRWLDDGLGIRGSCVAIGPSYVITTRHQGYGPGWSVVIAGSTYTIQETFDLEGVDLRIARISAGLTAYVAPYTTTSDIAIVGKTVVIGGYGRGRGGELKNGGIVYGYTWGTADMLLRWGQNRIDSVSSATYRGLTSQTVVAHFDDLGAAHHVDREAAVAEFDSGGGWFIDVSAGHTGDWRLAALSRGTEHYGETWFKNPDGSTHADAFDGVRISSYYGWLNGVISPSTWVGGSGNWSTATKWSPSGVPSAKDKWAVFGDFGAVSLSVAVDQPVTIGIIRFDGPTSYTLGGPSRLTFSVSSGPAGIEINRLAEADGTGSYQFLAPITIMPNVVLAVNQGSTGTLTFSSAISGMGSLTKGASGTAILAATNDYCGGTTVKAGTLSVTAAGGLGSGQVNMAGGTLELRSDSALTLSNSVLLTANTTINVDRASTGSGLLMRLGPVTFGGDWKLTAKSANGYDLGFTGLATFSGAAPTIETTSADVVLSGGVSLPAGALTKTGPGVLTIAGASQTWGTNTAINVSAGTVRLNADAGTTTLYNMTLNVGGAGARAELGSTQHLAALNLTGAGASVDASPWDALVTKSLAISPSAGTLDLASSALIVRYTGGTPGEPSPAFQNVKQWIIAGYNGGTWTGATGITDSAAAAYPESLGLGYAQNDMLDTPLSQFAGEPVDSRTVLVRDTLLGDLDLNGTVDLDDLILMGAYWDPGHNYTHTWWQGDMDYNGWCDLDDLILLASNWNLSMPGSFGGTAGGIGAGALAYSGGEAVGGDTFIGAVVPEPATILLVAAGAAGLASRRRLGSPRRV
jgi:autotransporter-associated beta strand protein